MRSGSSEGFLLVPKQIKLSSLIPLQRFGIGQQYLGKYCPFLSPSQVDNEISTKLEAVTMLAGSTVLVLNQDHNISNITKNRQNNLIQTTTQCNLHFRCFASLLKSAK